MTADSHREIVVSAAEWEALLRGARVLRDVAEDHRRAGAHGLAAERDRDAAELQRLVEHAVVAANPDGDRRLEAER